MLGGGAAVLAMVLSSVIRTWSQLVGFHVEACRGDLAVPCCNNMHLQLLLNLRAAAELTDRSNITNKCRAATGL
jgi:hypothetical protein